MLLCVGRDPRGILDFVLGRAQERRGRRAPRKAAPKPLTAMPLTGVRSLAGCIAC
jgi:hypothetical protein